MRNDELKPCPCCRGKAQIIMTSVNGHGDVVCSSCGIRTSPYMASVLKTTEESVSIWNTRHTPEPSGNEAFEVTIGNCAHVDSCLYYEEPPHEAKALTAQKVDDEKSEWFFRWIARYKAGTATLDEAIGVIWHHPDNPYFENNPWKE